MSFKSPASTSMPPGSPRWNDKILDEMRSIGDPFADNIVAELFTSTDPGIAWQAMMRLDTNDPPDSTALPGPLQKYLAGNDTIRQRFMGETVGGQRLYEQYCPIMFFILATYSLPASYGAKKGVQVIHRTNFIEKRPDTRLAQTGQIVENILRPRGVDARTRGVRSIEKVRLIHSAIRFLIKHDRSNPWLPENGEPINQEDLAGTLMVFSYLILDGLRKLGIEIPEGDQGDFLKTWGDVGRLMGIREDLIPNTLGEAGELCRLIQKRQVRPSLEGKDAAQSLLHMLEGQGGRLFHRWPAAAMRFFLPTDVANDLDIPFHLLEESTLRIVSAVDFILRRDNPFRIDIVRKIGMELINLFIRENTELYRLPASLMGGPGKFPQICVTK